jgi:apolipoprotein N-acyltransferase
MPMLKLALMTLSSAALYSLAFPPHALHGLVFVALVPFFAVVVRLRPAPAFGWGALFGVCAAAGVASWLPGMTARYFAVPTQLGWLAATAVFFGLAGVYYGGFAGWLAWLARRGRAHPLAVAVGFGACEYARATLLVPNPWALSAYSQPPGSALLQSAALAGPYALGMLIAGVNASLAGLLVAPLRGRRLWGPPVAAALALGIVLAYGEWRLAHPTSDARPLEVAVVQGAPAPDAADGQARLATYLGLTRHAAASGPDLVLWPENAVPFYVRDAGPLTDALLRGARESGADLVLGAPDYRPALARTHYFNSTFLVREGRLAGVADKVRLMPFSETRPLEPWLGLGSDRLTPGQRVRTLPARGARVGTLVCSEAMHPEQARAVARAGAEVLASPANDVWFASEAAARQQLTIASVRAIETDRYLLRAAATGYSAVIDPRGRVVARSGFGVPQVIRASIRPSQSVTPYQVWGDLPAAAACAAALILTVLPPRSRAQHARKTT